MHRLIWSNQSLQKLEVNQVNKILFLIIPFLVSCSTNESPKPEQTRVYPVVSFEDFVQGKDCRYLITHSLYEGYNQELKEYECIMVNGQACFVHHFINSETRASMAYLNFCNMEIKENAE